MSHYPSLTSRRFALLGAERPYYTDPPHFQSISAPTSQYWQPFQRSSSSGYLANVNPVNSSFSPCWNNLSLENSGWPIQSPSHSSYSSSSSNLSSEYSTPSDYPESSQRTILSSSPPAHPSSAVGPLNHYNLSPIKSPSQSSADYDDHSWGDELFCIEDQDVQPELSPPASSLLSAVKAEPEDADSCFIMELSAAQSTLLSQALAPPIEVPLRATQASKEMRKMMGSFRLNPFAMHSGAGRGVVPSSWDGGEARPLDEEPMTFEFQLELLEGPLCSPKEELRSFSPDFELENDHDDGEGSEWTEFESQPTFQMTSTWDLEYPASEELLSSSSSSSESTSTDVSSRRSSRLHDFSHPYLRKIGYADPQDRSTASGTCITTTSSSNLSVDMNRSRLRRLPSEPSSSWPHIAYAQSSRSTICAADSMHYNADTVTLPSIAASTNRRWSLPDPNLNPPFLM